MYTFLIVLQILFALGLIVLVLLQHGKGADAGAAFGSGASSTVFGSQGSASFLTRGTAVLATLFFLNSLLLSTPWVMENFRAPGSVAEQMQPLQQQPEEQAAPDDLPPPAEQPAQQNQGAAQDDLPAVEIPPGGNRQSTNDLPE